MVELTSLQVLALGERDYPLSPQFRIRAESLQQIQQLLEEGARRLPDLTMEDVLRLVLRAGAIQVQQVLDADGRIERGGLVSFSPTPPGQAGKRLDALRGQVIKSAGLVEHRLLIGVRDPVTPPQPQGPKDTVSHVTSA